MSNLDFISRSELLAEIDQERKRHIDSGNYGAEHLMVHSLRRLSEEAPAVDTAPVVHASYGFVGPHIGSLYASHGTCGNCKERILIDPRHNKFCPNCGAKMDQEEA